MKRYLLQATLFVAIIGCALVLAECVVRHMPNSYSYKSQWMDANASRVKTLVLGGSRTYYDIRPSLLGDSAFNLAQVTQHPEYDWWLLEKYIDHCPDLNTVIMSVDESNLFEPPLEECVEWHRCIYYNIYMGYPKHRNELKYSLELSNIVSLSLKLGPAVGYLVTGRSTLDCDSAGWGSDHDRVTFDEPFMYRTARQIYERIKDADAVEYNSEYLYKIARLCHERGIRLVLVSTPSWSEYIAMFDQSRFDTMHSVAAKCVSEWGAEYYDYTNDSSYAGLDFRDPNHLSHRGADKFTTMLGAKLKESAVN